MRWLGQGRSSEDLGPGPGLGHLGQSPGGSQSPRAHRECDWEKGHQRSGPQAPRTVGVDDRAKCHQEEGPWATGQGATPTGSGQEATALANKVNIAAKNVTINTEEIKTVSKITVSSGKVMGKVYLTFKGQKWYGPNRSRRY